MLYQTSSPSFFPAVSKAESMDWENPLLGTQKLAASREKTIVEIFFGFTASLSLDHAIRRRFTRG
jgi:hypothetical protein